jgi:hypothetical protein
VETRTTTSQPDQAELENVEPDTITTLLCQQAEACDSEGNCFETEREIEFAVDDHLITWMACYNFRSCEGEKEYFTEEQILSVEYQCTNR